MYENDPEIDIVDIIENQYITSYASMNGNLEMLEWLYLIHPNIDFKDCLHEACQNKHLNIVQWVKTIMPDKYLIRIDEDGNVTYSVNKNYTYRKRQSTIDTNNLCPICYDNECNLETTCLHTFCKTCINQYESNSCPYCRTQNIKYYCFEKT